MKTKHYFPTEIPIEGDEITIYFKDKSICELRYQDVEDFQQYLKDKKIGNTTINNHLTYFKMFMDVAVKKEIIEPLADSKNQLLI